MFLKTSSLIFRAYGNVHETLPFTNYIQTTLQLSSQSYDFYYVCEECMYLEVQEGMILLSIKNQNGHEDFVIHHIVELNPQVYFNFICLTNEATIHIYTTKPNNLHKIGNISPYAYLPIKPIYKVEEIYAYYRQIRPCNYVFEGEKHPYYELTYVESNQLQTTLNEQNFILNPHDIILYKPNEYHSQTNIFTHSCSVITILFNLNMQPKTFEKSLYKATNRTKELFQEFMQYTQQNPHHHAYMINTLEQILLSLENPIDLTNQSSYFMYNTQNELIGEIVVYIQHHIQEALQVEDICLEFGVSRTTLQNLFKQHLNASPKEYMNHMKLEKSKMLIKEGKYTISQIADILGFTSIHYFSKKFKAIYHISPLDYAKNRRTR